MKVDISELNTDSHTTDFQRHTNTSSSMSSSSSKATVTVCTQEPAALRASAVWEECLDVCLHVFACKHMSSGGGRQPPLNEIVRQNHSPGLNKETSHKNIITLPKP